MKKLIGLLLVVTMLISITACGNKNKVTDNYCETCSGIISADATFCKDCNPSSSEETPNTNTSSTESMIEEEHVDGTEGVEENIENFKPSMQNNTVSNKRPTISITDDEEEDSHKHSYKKVVTSPTCTEEGYTTYKCSCGNSYVDDYTDPAHKYSNHACSECGVIEPSYTYQYLLNWYNKNGNESVTIKKFDGLFYYTLEYDASKDSLYLKEYSRQYESYSYAYYETKIYTNVYLKATNNKFDYHFYTADITRYNDPYSYTNNYIGIDGLIDGKKYTGSSLDYETYTGKSALLYNGLKAANTMTKDLLKIFASFLEENIPEISVEGLGFVYY